MLPTTSYSIIIHTLSCIMQWIGCIHHLIVWASPYLSHIFHHQTASLLKKVWDSSSIMSYIYLYIDISIITIRFELWISHMFRQHSPMDLKYLYNFRILWLVVPTSTNTASKVDFWLLIISHFLHMFVIVTWSAHVYQLICYFALRHWWNMPKNIHYTCMCVFAHKFFLEYLYCQHLLEVTLWIIMEVIFIGRDMFACGYQLSVISTDNKALAQACSIDALHLTNN